MKTWMQIEMGSGGPVYLSTQTNEYIGNVLQEYMNPWLYKQGWILEYEQTFVLY